MNNAPKLQSHFRRPWRQRPFRGTGISFLLLLILLAACSPKNEIETVEVTRIVTETVVEEGETIAVTRVVTETVVETVEVEPTDGDSPSATGSEGDAGPLPPPPNDEPKVHEGRGSTQVAELILETAVTLRATQPHTSNNGQPAAPNNLPAINPTELQKWCQRVRQQYKKQCLLP